MKVEEIEFTRSVHTPSELVRDRRPQIAFVGRSNVGKSSLLNRLVGRKKLAHVSSTPGRTRGINYFLLNRRFYFVDFPGYGYAKVGKSMRRDWARLTTEYFEQVAEWGLIVQIVDAKVGATPLDVEAAEFFRRLSANVVVVATKTDKVRRSNRHKQIQQIRDALCMDDGDVVVEFSALSGDGVQQVWKEINGYLTSMSDRSSEVHHG